MFALRACRSVYRKREFVPNIANRTLLFWIADNTTTNNNATFGYRPFEQRERNRQRQPSIRTRSRSSSAGTFEPSFVVQQQQLDDESSSDRERENCPACRRYSRGPCGKLFRKWHRCIHDDNNDDEDCHRFGEPLAECLDEFDDYYSNLSIDEDEDDDSSNDAWQEAITSLEHSTSERQTGEGRLLRMPFPDDNVQLRALGIVTVPRVIHDRELVLAYVKDTDHVLLGAGTTHDDLMGSDEQSFVVTFGSTDQSHKGVTVHALYRGDDGEEILYDQTLKPSSHDDT